MHLVSANVSRREQNREKSQSKIDQDFGRNRKTVETGGYCIFPNLQKVQNVRNNEPSRSRAPTRERKGTAVFWTDKSSFLFPKPGDYVA